MSALPGDGRWQVLALRYASRPSSRENVFYRYHEYGEPDGPQEMAYYIWVLRNRDATILVDTGYSAAGGARRGRGHLIAPMAALDRAGISPDRIDLVVNTHLHYDHTGHLDAFPQTPMLVNRTELGAWTGPLAGRFHYAAHIEPDEVAVVRRRAEQGSLTLMSGLHPVADGIVAIEVGGHSPGQTILVIEGELGPVVLASDAVHFYEEIDRDLACGVLVDLEQVYGAYDTIRDRMSEAGARLLAGHDPLVLERFEPFPGAAAEFAVRAG
jgi:glyoxylase-like metal-dependent hydrolase (beta-lactamase superfamily II)